MPFPRALAQSETQTFSFSIWTRITGFIASDYNRYGKRTAYKNKNSSDRCLGR